MGRNSSKILFAQVTSKNYRTKNNLLLLIRWSIFPCLYLCILIYILYSYRNKNKKFNLLPLTELWHMWIVTYSIDNVFDIFQTLSFFSCLVSQFLYFDLHLLYSSNWSSWCCSDSFICKTILLHRLILSCPRPLISPQLRVFSAMVRPFPYCCWCLQPRHSFCLLDSNLHKFVICYFLLSSLSDITILPSSIVSLP